MGQADLAQSGVKGMLFLFPPHHLPVFWMKNTPEPLWLLFVLRGKVERNVYMPPCKTGECVRASRRQDRCGRRLSSVRQCGGV